MINELMLKMVEYAQKDITAELDQESVTAAISESADKTAQILTLTGRYFKPFAEKFAEAIKLHLNSSETTLAFLKIIPEKIFGEFIEYFQDSIQPHLQLKEVRLKFIHDLRGDEGKRVGEKKLREFYMRFRRSINPEDDIDFIEGLAKNQCKDFVRIYNNLPIITKEWDWASFERLAKLLLQQANTNPYDEIYTRNPRFTSFTDILRKELACRLDVVKTGEEFAKIINYYDASFDFMERCLCDDYNHWDMPFTGEKNAAMVGQEFSACIEALNTKLRRSFSKYWVRTAVEEPYKRNPPEVLQFFKQLGVTGLEQILDTLNTECREPSSLINFIEHLLLLSEDLELERHSLINLIPLVGRTWKHHQKYMNLIFERLNIAQIPERDLTLLTSAMEKYRNAESYYVVIGFETKFRHTFKCIEPVHISALFERAVLKPDVVLHYLGSRKHSAEDAYQFIQGLGEKNKTSLMTLLDEYLVDASQAFRLRNWEKAQDRLYALLRYTRDYAKKYIARNDFVTVVVYLHIKLIGLAALFLLGLIPAFIGLCLTPKVTSTKQEIHDLEQKNENSKYGFTQSKYTLFATLKTKLQPETSQVGVQAGDSDEGTPLLNDTLPALVN